jgi:type I restriction enzyme R subunit
MTQDKASQIFRLDERNHVEKPFLDELHGLGWEIIDLDNIHRTTTTVRRLPEIP